MTNTLPGLAGWVKDPILHDADNEDVCWLDAEPRRKKSWLRIFCSGMAKLACSVTQTDYIIVVSTGSAVSGLF